MGSSFGNLRARNYSIDEVEKFQAKLKAGRIIPAISTTTAMATGFVLLELYKQLIFGKERLEVRRNLFANLALPGPNIILTEPAACAKIKSGQRWDPDMYMDVDEVAYPDPHTLWDQICVPAASSMTLADLCNWFKSDPRNLVLTELGLSMLDGTNGGVYSSTRAAMAQKNEANLPRNLVELISEMTGFSIAGTGLYELDRAIFATPDGDDVTAARVV